MLSLQSVLYALNIKFENHGSDVFARALEAVGRDVIYISKGEKKSPNGLCVNIRKLRLCVLTPYLCPKKV